MTPEGKVKLWATDILKRELPGAVIYRPPGGAFGKAGEPDIHVTYGGCKMVIEAKTEDNDATKLQMKRLIDYHKAGALAMLLRGYNEARLMNGIRLLKERAACLAAIIGQQNQG